MELPERITPISDILDDPSDSSRRILDVALDAAAMGTWRYRLDDNVCLFSERAQELYGVDSAHVRHDDAGVRRMLHPDDVDTMWRAVAAACHPSGDGRYSVEYRVHRHEGGWRWLSVWGLAEFSGEGPHRRALWITGASRDVTDRKRAEMFLDAQKRSLEMVVTGAPLKDVLTHLTLVVERQAEGEVVASILLLDDEGRLRDGASPSLPDDYVQAIDGLKAHPELGTCSVAAVTASVVVTPDIDADPKWQSIKHLPLDLGLKAAWSHPIMARDGRVLGTFGTYFRECREPSTLERQAVEILSRTAALAIERARAEEALRQADRRKDEFIATLSHELRNPLAPLSTALHLLQSNGDNPESSARLRATMKRQVDHLVRLVDDLLEVARINQGTLELRRERVEVAAIVRTAVETSEPLLQTSAHQLSVSLPTQPLWVDGDPMRLAQILGNLLNNAAKYTDPGGSIAVEAHERDGGVELAVRDSGAGIAPEAMPRLFEMFVRLPHTTARHQGGLGIGLALARRLAEMHGGTLQAFSDGVGKGSVFTLRLPLATVAPSVADAAANDRAGEPALSGRVLIADDNRDAADTTALLLTELGCQVATVYDGESAVAEAERFRPDVVLLDIGMPGTNGYDVCRQIRRQPWGTTMTIVALTGWGQERDQMDSAAAGFDRHLVKPVDPDALVGLLNRT